MTINTYYNKKTNKTIVKTYKRTIQYDIRTRGDLQRKGYELKEIIRIDEEAIAKMFRKK